LVLAEAASAAWLRCYGLIMLATRPRRRLGSADGVAQMAELPPPAIAAVLVRASGMVPRVAAATLLLDLVARRIVTEARDAEEYRCE
jgi:Holliday junction resolvase-like predicted endonuclease